MSAKLILQQQFLIQFNEPCSVCVISDTNVSIFFPMQYIVVLLFTLLYQPFQFSKKKLILSFKELKINFPFRISAKIPPSISLRSSLRIPPTNSSGIPTKILSRIPRFVYGKFATISSKISSEISFKYLFCDTLSIPP